MNFELSFYTPLWFLLKFHVLQLSSSSSASSIWSAETWGVGETKTQVPVHNIVYFPNSWHYLPTTAILSISSVGTQQRNLQKKWLVIIEHQTLWSTMWLKSSTSFTVILWQISQEFTLVRPRCAPSAPPNTCEKCGLTAEEKYLAGGAPGAHRGRTGGARGAR